MSETQESPRRPRHEFQPRYDIAARYLIGAVAIAALALFAGIWGLLLAWIAVVLLMMAAAYARVGPGVYAKRRGRIPILVRLTLWPHMLGLFIARQLMWRRHGPPYARVGSSVLLGRLLTRREARELVRQHHISGVLDLTAEHAEAAPLRALPYLNIPILDMTQPTEQHCRAAIEFMARHSRDGLVYVHCGFGHGRSAAIAAAFLLSANQARTSEDAFRAVVAARPGALRAPEFRRFIELRGSASRALNVR